MSHRLFSAAGTQCRVPHGHSSVVRVFLQPAREARWLTPQNVYLPFESIKSRWHGWIDQCVDQSLMLSEHDTLLEYLLREEADLRPRLMRFPGDPSAELVAAAFFAKLQAMLRADAIPFALERLELQETDTNCVAFGGSWQDFLPSSAGEGRYWWERADLSIA